MKRNNLTLRAKTTMSQKLPDDLETKIQSFHAFIKKQQEDEEFDDRLIINMDETPMYFDLVPGRTVEQTGVKSVRVKTTASDKRHFTIVLACSAAGDMLPPMIIFKGKRELSFLTRKGWVVTVQEKGWVDEAIMIRWVKEILVPFTRKDRTLLMLDSFRSHLTDGVKKVLRRMNIVPAVIPGGCTSKVQPLDVSINKPFKWELRKSWTAFMRAAVLKSVETKERIKPATKHEVVQWIEGAIDTIAKNKTMIMKAFLVCGISNSLSGSDNNLVRNDTVFDSEFQDFFDSDDDDEEFEGFDPEDLGCFSDA